MDAALRPAHAVTVQITAHAAPGHPQPPPQVHYDPPSAAAVLASVVDRLRRKPVFLSASRQPDGRVAIFGGAAEAFAPLAYIDGLPPGEVVLALQDLAAGRAT